MATVEQYLSVLAGAQSAQNAEAQRAAAQMQIEVRSTRETRPDPPPSPCPRANAIRQGFPPSPPPPSSPFPRRGSVLTPILSSSFPSSLPAQKRRPPKRHHRVHGARRSRPAPRGAPLRLRRPAARGVAPMGLIFRRRAQTAGETRVRQTQRVRLRPRGCPGTMDDQVQGGHPHGPGGAPGGREHVDRTHARARRGRGRRIPRPRRARRVGHAIRRGGRRRV